MAIGPLSALTVRHALAHGCGNAQRLVRCGMQHVGGAGRLELVQLHLHHLAAGALDLGAHRAGVGCALQ